MLDEDKNLIAIIKEYVSTYEELPFSDDYKLTIQKKPTPPYLHSPQEPSFKAKALMPLKTDQLIKTTILCVAELALLVLFILCCANTFGFGITLFLAPVSIGLLIFIGIKIKNNNGISYYLKAKKENEQKIRYNQKHEKEIQEALNIANARNKEAFEKHKKEKEEYEKRKYIYDFCEMFELKLGSSISKKQAGLVFDCGDGKKKFLISPNNLKELLQYYIDQGVFENSAKTDDLFEDISEKIVSESEDTPLSEFVNTLRKEHYSAVRCIEDDLRRKRIQEMETRLMHEESWERGRVEREARKAAEEDEKRQKEEEIKQKRKAQDARTKCYHCKHYDTCTVKGRIDCPMYVIKI